MSEEDILAKAYRVLGLEPGASMDAINRRYKRLIMVWHPDRFPTDDGKKDAEEELKQINDAKDKLKKHFETAHKASGSCACRPTAGASAASSASTKSGSGQGPGPGPGRRKTTQETDREEAEAQRRNDERARRATAEAAEKDRQAREAANATAAQKAAQEAVDQEKLIQDERLRWKVTLCLAAAWIGLSIVGWAGMSLKHWWHDVSWKWQNSSNSSSSSSSGNSTVSNSTASQPYVQPYEQPPTRNNNPKLWQDPFAVAQPPTNQNASGDSK